MNEIQTLRLHKDEFFAHDHHSPLTHDQKQVFTGLDYFTENPDLRIEVVVEENVEKEEFLMQTSTGDYQPFQRYGKFNFEVEGQTAELTVYVNEHGYFLPFVDNLRGTETYPAGRYLEPEPISNGKFLVDFNLAYNPYCAYNEMFSCPLPPAENRLDVPIRAGEKIFKQEDVFIKRETNRGKS
jgi:uncharacterized protein (DUF1684 family)